MQVADKIIPIAVEAVGVSKSFPREGGGRVEALRDLTLHAPAGSFVSILGPSGSGKSTLLGILAGLDAPDSGTVSLTPANEVLSSTRQPKPNPKSEIRNPKLAVGYMPQRDLLLPWRTALDNATVGLEVAGLPREEARRRVLPLMDEFGLEGFAGSYPSQLSGGMRQRVSFLRSAVLARGLMLLDEPFGALDALTRANMHEWLLEASERMGSTFLLVTHDVDEAILLSDRVYVLSPRPGRVIGQVDIEIERPRSLESLNDERFARYRTRLLGLLRSSGGLDLRERAGGAL
jgi:ABC-type nitrate/sulfonate/bicarbonate transport system ATPase subunit